jgi:arginine decarboxylase
VHYEPSSLAENFQQLVSELTIPESQKQQYLAELQAGLEGYTYFED